MIPFNRRLKDLLRLVRFGVDLKELAEIHACRLLLKVVQGPDDRLGLSQRS